MILSKILNKNNKINFTKLFVSNIIYERKFHNISKKESKK